MELQDSYWPGFKNLPKLHFENRLISIKNPAKMTWRAEERDCLQTNLICLTFV